MILGKYQIDNAFVDLSKGNLNLSGPPYVLAANSGALPEGYAQINTFAAWTEGCRLLNKDYIFCREAIKANMLPVWSDLSSAEKKFLLGMVVYPGGTTQEEIDASFNASEQLENWKNLTMRARDARNARWRAAARTLSFYLPQLDSLDLYSSTVNYSLSFIDAGAPHLTLWFINGTYAPLSLDFSSSGFAQKGYYTADIKNLYLDIIVNGNY